MHDLRFDVVFIADEMTCQEAQKPLDDILKAVLDTPFSPRTAILLRRWTTRDGFFEDHLGRLLEDLKKSEALFFAHNSPHLAVAADLDGIHLRDGEDIQAARQMVGNSRLVGISQHAETLSCAPMPSALDYAFISPIARPTSTKKKPRPPLGLSFLKEAAKRAPQPLVALGGITPDNAAAMILAGAKAVAVMGGLIKSDDPKKSITQLHRSVMIAKAG